MSSTNYEILENTTDWVVVRLTATPTDDIMEEIASINSAIYPILVTSLDFEAARKISADNRGVIRPTTWHSTEAKRSSPQTREMRSGGLKQRSARRNARHLDVNDTAGLLTRRSLVLMRDG
jgi:streptogramin lyase